jgi:hypothetical protein
MRIKDVLQSKGSTTVITIAPGATIRELVELLATHNIGAVVVARTGPCQTASSPSATSSAACPTRT